MNLIVLHKIEHGPYNEDTGTTEEIGTQCAVNVAAIRCFYARHNNKPGTRITFTDGGGFAVTESLVAVADRIGDRGLVATLEAAPIQALMSVALDS